MKIQKLITIDVDLFGAVSSKAKFIFTVEEGVIQGGFGSAVQEAVGRSVYRIALPDEFIPHGSREILLNKYGLTSAGIAKKVKSLMLKARVKVRKLDTVY